MEQRRRGEPCEAPATGRTHGCSARPWVAPAGRALAAPLGHCTGGLLRFCYPGQTQCGSAGGPRTKGRMRLNAKRISWAAAARLSALALVASCGGNVPPSGPPPAIRVTIDSPANGDIFEAGETVVFNATAEDVQGLSTGIQTLSLHAGNADGIHDTLLTTCPAGSAFPTMTCTFSFLISSSSALVADNEITLTAAAIDPQGHFPASATVTVRVRSCQMPDGGTGCE